MNKEQDHTEEYWCCGEDFGKHEPHCPNFVEVPNPPMSGHWE